MKMGLYTLLLENPMNKYFLAFKMEFGWGMGYVLIPKNHPFYGLHYDDIPVNVHGGLTYSDKFKVEHFLEWIKDRDSLGDVTKDNYEKFNEYWMIGFDTSHAGDDSFNCNKDYVLNETNRLLEQCLDDKIEGMKKYKTIYLRKDKLKAINNI